MVSCRLFPGSQQARGAATVALKLLPDRCNRWQKHPLPWVLWSCHVACVPCFCLGLPASVTKALHAGMQVCAELVAPTHACLLPPTLRQELATGPQVPFAGGQAKWHWICFCSLLRVAWSGRGLGSLGAARRGGLCSPVLCPSQACECGDTGTGVVCVAWGGEVGTCRLSPHPPVPLQAVCVSQ